MKAVVFHPGALDAIRRFPKEVRERVGRSLFQLQMGERLGMPHSRPMPAVAPGMAELRIAGIEGVYRALYYTLAPKSILVCHAFVKKTQQTPPSEIRIAAKRFRELIDV